MFTISKTLELDAGHRVPSHSSKCKNLHGHRYKVQANCEASSLVTKGGETAMVMDFGFLKHFLMRQVHDPFDHKLILYWRDPLVELLLDVSNWRGTQEYFSLAEQIHPCVWQTKYEVNTGTYLSLVVTSFIPTAEELARYWYFEVYKSIGIKNRQDNTDVKLRNVKVYETPTSVASYSTEE